MLAEEAARVILLFDFYGGLLPSKQQEIITLYYGENLTLSEIGENHSMSRQGVHDALKKATKALQEYDDKLRLLKKFQSAEAALEVVMVEINKLTAYIEAADEAKADDQIAENGERKNVELIISKERLTDSLSLIYSALQRIEF